METTGIGQLPDEVLELILSFVCPYRDYPSCSLVCSLWNRLIAGNYPSPKACASMNVWRNLLVVFGGWSQPTPFPLHQAAQFFDQLHLYDTDLNIWTAVNSDPWPPPVAGHAACMMSDSLVVFGGSRQHGTSSDALWVLDMPTQSWRELTVGSDRRPLPRYGASLCSTNSNQAVLLGGCGGPNMKFTDCWLLNINRNIAMWTELVVENTENSCPPPLWCHPVCKVGDFLVVLSKTSLPVQPEVLRRISERRSYQNLSEDLTSRVNYSSSSSDDEDVRSRSNISVGSLARNHQQRRQKQLEMLEKFERRLRSHQSQRDKEPEKETLLKQPMFLHSLDISTAIDGCVSWNVSNLVDVYGEVAEETFFYTLTEGKEELILFGGVHPGIEQGVHRAPSSSLQALNTSLFSIHGHLV
ncbi:F-box only protein 42-like isoform X2 [Watersipora subatra]|uniref:F-box only protein 42-like isoform X2 n=1 Tax=Watersipora subatra TaxID=2589382 RepID=UPI00355AFCB9